MTLDEHREACIEALKVCYRTYNIGYFEAFQAAQLLDSLHGIARVVPAEATGEMLKAAHMRGGYAKLFEAMAAAGDLTNSPGDRP